MTENPIDKRGISRSEFAAQSRRARWIAWPAFVFLLLFVVLLATTDFKRGLVSFGLSQEAAGIAGVLVMLVMLLTGASAALLGIQFCLKKMGLRCNICRRAIFPSHSQVFVMTGICPHCGERVYT